MAAEPANPQSTTDDAAEAGTERQPGRRAKAGAARAAKPRATSAAKPSRPAPGRDRAPAADARPVDEAAAAAPEPVAETVAALSEPVAAAVQASQAMAAAPAVPPQFAVLPQLWPGGVVRAGQAALESGLHLQREAFTFALAQAARNWKAGQALARCGSLPAAAAVQRELIEQTVAHGSACLGSLSRLTAEAVQAALPPLRRR